jgi:RNA polymerase sigma factor (sigma-70 family)
LLFADLKRKGDRRLACVTLPPFEAIVAEHGAMVLRVCRALVRDDEAQDAASETFLSALEAYDRLRPGSDVKAWLLTIAHRKAIDVLRRRARQALPMADLPELVSQGDAVEFPDASLWENVRALPDKQRHAVAYHYIADLPYADVAGVMGVSEAAARRSAADGIRALRSRFPVRPEEEPL